LPLDPPARGITPPSALPRVEECTYFWGVKNSWGINTAESKRPLNQEDNQAPQPTHGFSPNSVEPSPQRPRMNNTDYPLHEPIEDTQAIFNNPM
jgi:hypothetical protein